MPSVCRIAESNSVYPDVLQCSGLLDILLRACDLIREHVRPRCALQSLSVSSDDVQPDRSDRSEATAGAVALTSRDSVSYDSSPLQLWLELLQTLRAALWSSQDGVRLAHSRGSFRKLVSIALHNVQPVLLVTSCLIG